MELHLPEDVRFWIDSSRGDKSRQRFIRELLHENMKNAYLANEENKENGRESINSNGVNRLLTKDIV